MPTITREDKDTHLVEVFAGSPWGAELTKGLLRSNGIESILEDGDGLVVLAPYYIGQEIAVLVNGDDYEQAMEIVRGRGKANEQIAKHFFSSHVDMPARHTYVGGVCTIGT